MRYTKLLLISYAFLLTGCLDVYENDTDSFSQPVTVQPQAPAPAPAPQPVVRGTHHQKPTTPPCTTTDCACPESSCAKTECGCPDQGQTPQPKPEEPSSSNSLLEPDLDWNPNEGQLVKAGELVMELQRSNGGVRPSHAAMANHVRVHMGLTAPQAEKILEEMGL